MLSMDMAHRGLDELEAFPIYFKSRFLPADFSGRDRQIAYEAALMATGLFKADAAEPKWTTVLAALGTMSTV